MIVAFATLAERLKDPARAIEFSVPIDHPQELSGRAVRAGPYLRLRAVDLTDLVNVTLLPYRLPFRFGDDIESSSLANASREIFGRGSVFAAVVTPSMTIPPDALQVLLGNRPGLPSGNSRASWTMSD